VVQPEEMIGQVASLTVGVVEVETVATLLFIEELHYY
jgi:hypothetical protein